MSVLKTTSNLQKNLAFARLFHIFFCNNRNGSFARFAVLTLSFQECILSISALLT